MPLATRTDCGDARFAGLESAFNCDIVHAVQVYLRQHCSVVHVHELHGGNVAEAAVSHTYAVSFRPVSQCRQLRVSLVARSALAECRLKTPVQRGGCRTHVLTAPSRLACSLALQLQLCSF
jgi:hypothetical protein